MSDNNEGQTQDAQTTAQPQAASVQPVQQAPAQPPQPVVDVEAVLAKTQEKLSETVAQQLARERQELANRIAGTKEEKKPHDLHVALAEDPENFFKQFGEVYVEKAKKELRAEDQAAKDQRERWASTKEPFNKEIPDLEKYEYELIGHLQEAVKENPHEQDINKHMSVAVDKVVDKFGLKRLSEEEQAAREKAMFTPGAAAAGFPFVQETKDPIQAGKDYISKLRADSQKARNWHGRHNKD